MPSYKITDYTYPTEGGLARLILTYQGIEFENVRFEKENASEAEAAAPFGLLPILEEDGQLVAAGQALCPYLAIHLDLAGKNIKEQAMCGTIMSGLYEMFRNVRREYILSMPLEER
ncbi:probable glutathione S-transferase 7, partial [Limulus polyphemus]|uniref:Probable glutathione S-transferase 7 n=1 Tax=Limulus polyphemus TaxID=6850 RepID=A0ABM1SVV1_LIMPO